MAILSIDFGKKRIGLALSRAGLLVSRYKTLENNNKIFENLKEICRKEEIEKIVIGLPQGIDFQKGESYEMAKKFGKKMREELKIKIEFFDEAFSSSQAEENLKKEGIKPAKVSELLDQESARIILEDYLKN